MRWLAVLAIACSPPRVAHRPRRFAPVAIRDVALAVVPGGLPCGVVLEPGFPLPPTIASWLHVHQDHPIWIDGWVPASARGFWRARPVRHAAQLALDAELVVRDSPDTDATVIAVLDSGTPADIDGEPGTWAPIEAAAARVRVAGWAIVPPRRIQTFDFDEELIEGDLGQPEGVRD